MYYKRVEMESLPNKDPGLPQQQTWSNTFAPENTRWQAIASTTILDLDSLFN
jgi:hypothetical protein